MLGVSLIIIAAAIVYMVETYISTYYTIEYMHGTSLFLILLAKYGTPVLFLLLCAYIAYRNFLKKQKAAASAASERPTSKEELYTNKIQTALTHSHPLRSGILALCNKRWLEAFLRNRVEFTAMLELTLDLLNYRLSPLVQQFQ